MRKSLLIGGGAIVAIAIVITAIVLSGIIEQEEKLVLSNYPKLFEKEAVIVIGENATQMEYESAEAIAENLHSITGNMPVIKSDIELTENDKAKYNLILVGGPRTNSVLEEIYEVTNATIVTSECPGENKGILEILRNPWNEDKAMLLVEGSDEWGVKAGSILAISESEIYHRKKVMVTDALIELGGTIRPVPQYVLLPVTLPIDTKEEALIIAKTCLERAIFRQQPISIVEHKDTWYLSGPKRQGLDYPFWSMTINKTTGKTEYVAVK